MGSTWLPRSRRSSTCHQQMWMWPFFVGSKATVRLVSFGDGSWTSARPTDRSRFHLIIEGGVWFQWKIRQVGSGQIAFVMVGHSFGLVAAVYNYNRRSALITDILRRVFHVAAFNFYDDKYGFEPADTVRSAFEVAQAVHFWLGARFDQKKLQIARAPTILGVTYDLVSFCLLIKEDRRIELIDEIEAILSSKMLSPGQAGKLRGKLMFGASQLWGKIGRAFLRSLSERQYSKVPSTAVNRAIELSLEEWKELIVRGPLRKIEVIGPRLPDVVVFTDGSYPDQSGKGPDHPWIGGVLFKRGCRPLQFGARVPLDLIQKWLPRKSQIAMVEMFAVVVALETFKEQLRGAWSLLFVDSEPVLGALVKGYSAREDMCELTGFFWKQALNLMCYLYLDRISTDANPADPPSRDKMSVGEKLGWQTIAASFPCLWQRGRTRQMRLDLATFVLWVRSLSILIERGKWG